jgi:RHS repeat-associated protein
VDERGSANYSIPIFVPPGTAGVQPSVALNYSSNADAGPIGKGWSISGVSSIGRCKQTREAGDFIVNGKPVDGDPLPVSLSATDRFCLDGQRLILVNGTYGSPDAEYRLELDRFTRIYSRGGTVSPYTGPSYFEVQRRDGSKSIYGGTDDSRLLANNQGALSVVQHWSISRFVDSTGNFIAYEYLKPAGSVGEQVISKIRYTGKERAGGQETPPYAAISFDYDTMPVTREFYVAGSRSQQTQRLRGINSNGARYYKLNYNAALTTHGNYLLKSVSECSDATQTVCYSAPVGSPGGLQFDYTSVPTAYPAADAYIPPSNIPGATAGYRLGDVDGDGKIDLVWISRDFFGTCGSNRSLLDVHFGKRRTTLPSIGALDFDRTSFGAGQTCLPYEFIGDDSANQWIQLTDYNGDGRDDLVIADNMTNNPNARWKIHPSRGRTISGSNGGGFDMSRDLLAEDGIQILVSETDTFMQFADVNGDGLTDMIYAKNLTSGANPERAFVVRFLDRMQASNGSLLAAYKYSQEYQIEFEAGALPSSHDCGNQNVYPAGCKPRLLISASGNGGQRLQDIDGDGRADFTVLLTPRPNVEAGKPGAESPLDRPFVTREELAKKDDSTDGPTVTPTYEVVFRTRGRDESALMVLVQPIMGNVRNPTATSSIGNLSPLPNFTKAFGDFNGDGLLDILDRTTQSAESYRICINRGVGNGVSGYSCSSIATPSLRAVQIVDINADGRSDLVYLPNQISFDDYRYMLSSPTGQLGTEAVLSAGVIRGGDTTIALFMDFDGDGRNEFVAYSPDADNTQDYRTASLPKASRSVPPDTMNKIINGYGAVTDLVYLPLVNKEVYRRDSCIWDANGLGGVIESSCTRNKDWDDTTPSVVDVAGRGGGVVDVLFPYYVVSSMESDAPTSIAPNSRSSVYYRYAGGKLQGGGRGFLGFRQVVSIDANFSSVSQPAHVVTTTDYSQQFPLIGAPIRTQRHVVAGNFIVDSCRGSNRDSDACGWSYASGGFPPVTGSLIQSASNLRKTIPAFSAGQAGPLFIYNELTQECTYHLPDGTGYGMATGVLTSYVAKAEVSHDAYGNPQLVGTDVHSQYPDGIPSGGCEQVSQISAARGSGYELSVLTRKRVESLFDNDDTRWHLGRMTSSTVTHSRRGAPGLPLESATRRTSFGYDTTTGLLNSEHVERGAGGDRELSTYYDLDEYGNRTAAYTCSSTVTEQQCRNPSSSPIMEFRPQDDTVRRFSRTEFDPFGRFPLRTKEPFYKPNNPGSWELRTSAEFCDPDAFGPLGMRDEFGEAQCALDVNLVSVRSRRGALGRDYWSGSITGSTVITTYAWCSGVNGGTTACPTGAKIRKQVVSNLGARSWTYLDVLGREFATVTESFNQGVTGKDASMVCKAFDKYGRTAVVTEPFFLAGTIGAAGPAASNSMVCFTGARYTTSTYYDVLGRVAGVIGPDGAVTAFTYSNLRTWKSVPCNNSGATQNCNRMWIEDRNAAGEVVANTDPYSTTTTYTRNWFGDVSQVDRSQPGSIAAASDSILFDAVTGRKMQQSNNDSGIWSYQYNAAGEVIRQTDAMNQVTTFDIDARGRVWRTRATSADSSIGMIEDEVQYDTAANGYGLVHWDTRRRQGASTVTRTMSYDAFARVATRVTQIQGKNYTESLAYDNLGRVLKSLYEFTETYVNGGSGVEQYREGYLNQYNARGYLARTCRTTDTSTAITSCPAHSATTPIYWEITEQNARGQTIKEKHDDSLSLETTRSFAASTGRIATIISGSGGQIQNLQYDFDLSGNLLYRRDWRSNQIERFEYDALDRLLTAKLDAQPQALTLMSLSYDALGNICSKNGLPYFYDGKAGCANAGGDPLKSSHQVRQVWGSQSYGYDANGNATTTETGDSLLRTLTYDPFNRIARGVNGHMFAPNFVADFDYAPDLQLALQRERAGPAANAATTRLTHYIGALEWTDRNPGGTANREARLGLPGGLILHTRFLQGSAQSSTRRYAFYDHLGSVDAIATIDKNGTSVIERMSFDAHGRRRDQINWTSMLISYGSDATTRKGYTGHEQLDGLGLVHMRARVYDPNLGRFLQADPMVEPDATQGWNRYTYVLNNALNATDPTGMLSRREALAAVRTIASIVIAVYAPQIMIGQMCATPALMNSAVVASGFMAGAVGGGLQGAVFGGFSAGIYNSIGLAYGGAVDSSGRVTNAAMFGKKILAHGLAGGTLNTLQGGKFGHGFVSGLLTEGTSPGIQQIDGAIGQAVTAALVGGTVSELTGGKFANGAVTAAFAQALRTGAGGGREETAEDRMLASVEYDPNKAMAWHWPVPPSFPDWFVEGAAGVGDSLSFGLLRHLRESSDIGGISVDSTAYQVGMYGSMAIGGARLAYAAGLKGFQMAGRAIGGMEGAYAASTGRNAMKILFRGGLFPRFRIYPFSQIVGKYGDDWSAIIAAAGRSNVTVNAAGVAAGGGAAANQLQLCAQGQSGC